MLNVSTLFLILFSFWMIISISVGITSAIIFSIGFFMSIVIAAVSYKIRIIDKKTSFLFLQLGFYKYVFELVNESFFNNFKVAYSFIRKNPKIDPIIDFIFLDKDNDPEIALYVNSLNLTPGVLCFSIKKRYVLIHSLDKNLFTLFDIYNTSNKVGLVNDDSLV
ncbi:Na+/H+ antiporter subunit E [Pseudomonadota bacterium]